MSLNHCAFMGRLVKKPELRRTNEGTAVASFTLAVDRDYQKDKTDFIDCTAWRSTAEFAEKYLDKGKMVAVTGSLQMREWKDKEGKSRTSAEINVDHIYFADSKPAAKTNDYEIIPDEPELPF